MRGKYLPLLTLIVILSACSKKSTGPSGVDFPNISSEIIATYHIVGKIVPPETVTGSITAEEALLNPGHGEMWRVRVKEKTFVKFLLESGANSWIMLYRVYDLSDLPQSIERLYSDSDTYGNTLIKYTLEPNKEYWLNVVLYINESLGLGFPADYEINVTLYPDGTE